MVITIFIVIPLCYPAFDTYYLSSIKEDTSKSFFWESPSSRTPITEEIFAEKCGTKPPLRVQQIKISTTKNNQLQNVLEKDMLLWTLNLQERLSTISITYPHNIVSPLISSSVLIEANNKNNPKKDPLPYTLSNLCFKPINDNRCLIHSPLEYWSNNAQRLLKDYSIFNTISKANKTNSFDIQIPIDSVFGNPVYDKRTGKIISADSIILTYFFKDIGDDCNEGETIAIWEMLWKKMAEDDSHSHYLGNSRIKAIDISTSHDESKHLLYEFNYNNNSAVDLNSGGSNISAEVVLLIVEYSILFSYISLSLRRLNSVKSKIGLAFSTIAQLLASLIISLSICSLFDITLTLLSWKMVPFVIMIIGVENVVTLTKAVTSTSMELEVKERVAKGLEGVGNSITKNVVTRLLLLPLSFVINVDSLQEFCIFISVAMITDYLLQMSLYITILSIDLRRLEISDLYNRKVITPITKSNNIHKLSVSVESNSVLSKISNSRNKIASFMMALLIIASLTSAYKVKTDLLSLTFVSDFFGNSTVPESNSNTTFWETSTATTTDKFWDIVNPQKSDQYFEFRPTKFISIIQNFDGGDTNSQSNNNQKSNNNGFLSNILIMNFDNWKSFSIRTLKSIIWFIKFIIAPAIAIIFATSSLVGSLVSTSDQTEKLKSMYSISHNQNKISLPSNFNNSKNNNYNNANKISGLSIETNSTSTKYFAIPRVVTLRGCHSADVDLLCANSYSKIISTGIDKHITSWNGKQGIPLKKLERYLRRCDTCKCKITGGRKKCISWPVRAMCISEQTDLAAAGFEDGVVRVWDLNSGQARFILKDTVEDVESLINTMSSYSTKERVTCLKFIVSPSLPSYNSSSSCDDEDDHNGNLNHNNYSNTFMSRSSSLSSLENKKLSVILLATYRNGYFREWDLVSGQVAHTIFTHQKGGITYLCVVGEDEKQDYNHDKLVVFTGARDGSVKCWARNIHHSHINESTPSNHRNNSNDSSSSQPHKFRWDLLYTIPGRPNYAITCIATKIIKKDSIGILVTGTSDGQVNVYDYQTSKLIVTLSKGLLAKQKSKKKHKKQKHSLLQQQYHFDSNGFINGNGNINGNIRFQNSSYSDQEWDDDDYEGYDTDEDDGEDDELSHEDSITNIIIHPLKEKSCPCGNTEEPGGFTIVTSSVDEKVLVWQLVRNVMDCTCISFNFDYNLSNNKANNKNLPPSSITSVKNNINDNLTRFKNNVSNQLNNHQKVAEWNGVVSYQSKFIGHISQLGGSAIVLAREHVVGVRKVKNSKNKQCHGAEGEWEVWMLDINEPQAIESNNLCTGDNNDIDNEDEDEEDDLVELSVQTISLVNEKDLLEEQQKHKKKYEQLKLQEKASSVELKGFVRRRRNITINNSNNNNNNNNSNGGPIITNKAFASSLSNHNHDHHNHDHHHHDDDDNDLNIQKAQKRCGSVMINKVNSDNDNSRNNNGGEQSLLNFEDENDKNEILPFAYIRQVVKVGEEGVAVAYGNFIKVVYFEGSSDDELIDNDVS